MYTTHYNATRTTVTTLTRNHTTVVELSCSTNPSLWNMVYVLLMCVLLLFSVAGNFIVVVAVVMSNKLTQRSSTFYFVASLACSDMVMAVFQIPFRIYEVLRNFMFCLGLFACYLRQLTDNIGNIASMLNLFLISVDRFLAVLFPYRYGNLLSHRRAKQIIAFSWAFASLWGLSGMIRWSSTSSEKSLLTIHILRTVQQMSCRNDNHTFLVVVLCGFYVPMLVIMTVLNIMILIVTIKQIRQIHKSTPRPSKILHNLRPNIKEAKRLSSGILLKELKATKTLGVVFLAFCVCWLPGTIIGILMFLNKDYFSRLTNIQRTFIWFTFLDILPMVNTMIDPLIYSFTNTMFRRAVADVWCKLMGKARRRDSMFISGVGTEMVSLAN